MHRVLAAVLAILGVAGLGGTGCGRDAGERSGPAAARTPPSAVTETGGADPATRAAAAVARFSVEDLVGQVLMPHAYGHAATQVSGASAAANKRYAGVATPGEMVTKYRLGGVILMTLTADDPTSTGRTSNLDAPEQIRRLTAGLHDAARRNPGGAPLLVSTDQEYGWVTRIRSGVVQLPSAMTFGATRDPARTEAAWRVAGVNLAALGINVDNAPVADVLGSPDNVTIGSRSFGSDPAAVADQVAAATRGLHGAGVAATLKHFPGHGDTAVDSHKDLPVLSQDGPTLERVDLRPFTAGISAGAGLVMSGHLDVQAIEPGTPATFSSKALIDLLRTRLGFTGVVVTDALNMAPAKRWAPGEAAVRAVLAGNDLLLMPPDLAAAQRGLLEAAASGRIPRSRLVEAATRVLTLRYRLASTPQPALSTLDTETDRAAARAVAAGAVTVLRGPCAGPLVRGTATLTGDARWAQQREWLTAALARHGVSSRAGGTVVRLLGLGEGPSAIGPADVTVAMDTPYVLGRAPGTLVATYSATEVAMQALAAVLAGKAAAPGRSPVPVAGLPASACAK